jgi:nucleoside transporter
MTTASTSDVAVTSKPPLSSDLQLKLSVMMFLQYAIWGAWLPLLFPFFTEYRGFTGVQIGYIAAVGAAGALVAPFIAGQIADRYFNTERFLALSHALGAVLVWQMAHVTSFTALMVMSFFYALLYTPTLALTNSLAFYHLPDRDRDFGKVRVWGTIGWIAVGIGIGQWLLYQAGTVRPEQVKGMGDAFRLSAILGVVLAAYCLMLPKTPPQRASGRAGGGGKEFAPGEALAEVGRNRALFWLFLISFPIACVHQFYFVRTSGYLGSDQLGLNNAANTINKIFGVGGGGLMTIGQMSEILVLAIMPLVAKRLPRKSLLSIGLLAYVLRFFIFAYLPHPWAVVPALALHGVCFGCFFFIAFMVVDEETTRDVRASAQNLYNLIIVGLGVIVGNLFAGWMDQWATRNGALDWRVFFSIPMWISLACLVLLLLTYPRRDPLTEPRGFDVAPAEAARV